MIVEQNKATLGGLCGKDKKMAVAEFKPSNFKLFMRFDLMRVVLCVMMLNKISQKWPLCV